jgi:hypothetical protein
MVIVEDARPPEPIATLEGEKDTTGFAGITVPDRLTVPLNPLRLAREMGMLKVEERGVTIIDVGSGIVGVDIVKSGLPLGITVTVARWNVDPLVALTVMVNVA